MELTHTFTVPAGVPETWAALLDVERIAGCMPGATLDAVDEDGFTGHVRVKLGPISLTYGGRARFAEVDEAARRAVIEASGKETKGAGTASATVVTDLAAAGDHTTVNVSTDLAVTGRPAQFGRGMMQDVSNRLLDQFVSRLSEQLAAATPAPTAATPADDSSLDLVGVAWRPVAKRLAIPALAVVAIVVLVVVFA